MARNAARFIRLAAGLLTLVAASQAHAQEALPAFPGAQGFGAGATGGRGGQVIKVTSLEADGPGTLQAALDAPGPRVIVFAVSGVIYGDVVISHGDVTIAGQTAPGAGITIAGRLFGAYDEDVDNIIVRHVRIRPTFSGGPGEQFDGAQLSLNRQYILDHVSIAWGVDETLDAYSAQHITVQYSTIEEGAMNGHPEGAHNYGAINGPDGHHSTFHHNLFVHEENRNPAVANGPCEVIGNVAYNVRHGFVHHNPASGPFNIIGNSYIRGGDDDLFPFFFDDESGFSAPDLRYFLADNFIEDPGIFTGVVNDPWSEQVHPSFDDLYAPADRRSPTVHDFAAEPGYVPTVVESPADAYANVVACAGAFPRDVVTRRMISELEERSGSWGVDAPADLLEGLVPGESPIDSDDDGMPDDWELSHGLDPNSADDSSSLLEGHYTAVEVYINELADAVACSGPAGPVPGGSGSSGSTSGGWSPDGYDDDNRGLHGACACRAAPADDQSGWLLGVLPLVLLLRRRRR